MKQFDLFRCDFKDPMQLDNVLHRMIPPSTKGNNIVRADLVEGKAYVSTNYYSEDITDLLKADVVAQVQRLSDSSPVEKDMVDRPDHYQGSSASMQAIDVIEEFGLNFNLGNVVKYLLRAGKKDPNKKLEDLKKAKWYLEREVDMAKGVNITIG